jgi:hypothetical protein
MVETEYCVPEHRLLHGVVLQPHQVPMLFQV